MYSVVYVLNKGLTAPGRLVSNHTPLPCEPMDHLYLPSTPNATTGTSDNGSRLRAIAITATSVEREESMIMLRWI
jgi:hypothetical protein